MPKAPADIRSLARKHTVESIDRLVHWLHSNNPKASVTAAVALLDRGWGRAHQSIEISGEVTNKVIRAPAIAATTQAWSAEHVPKQHTEH